MAASPSPRTSTPGVVLFHLAEDSPLALGVGIGGTQPQPSQKDSCAETAGELLRALIRANGESMSSSIDPTAAPLDLASAEFATRLRSGLHSSELDSLRTKHGFNEVVSKRPNRIWQLFSFFMGPTQWLIEIAIIISAVLSSWIDVGILAALLFVNAVVGFHEKTRAGNAIHALQQNLQTHCRVLRDAKIVELLVRELLPGDLLVLRLGDVAPADCVLLGISPGNTAESDRDAMQLLVDESQLTGETLPVRKGAGQQVSSGAAIKQGQMYALVTATGANAFLGRTASLMSGVVNVGYIQRQMKSIGNSLLAATVAIAIIFFVIKAAALGGNVLRALQYAIVITVVAIPLSMPIVLAVCTAVGAQQLASHGVIVKELHAMEDMASMTVLCSDKTGTLTLNELTLDSVLLPGQRPVAAGARVESRTADNAASHRLHDDDEEDEKSEHHRLLQQHDHLSETQELLLCAYLSSEEAPTDAIEKCVRSSVVARFPGVVALQQSRFAVVSFEPFDPAVKYTRALVHDRLKSECFLVAKGASFVLLRMWHATELQTLEQEATVDMCAARGLRTLTVMRTAAIPVTPSAALPQLTALACSARWQLAGTLLLFDPPRADTSHTIASCQSYGLSVKMITGDALAIAKEVAKRLGLHQNILPRSLLLASDTKERPHLPGKEKSIAASAPVMDDGVELAVIVPPVVAAVDGSVSSSLPGSLRKLMSQIDRCDGFAGVHPEDKFRIVELLQAQGHVVAMTGDGVNDAPSLRRANIGIAVHGCTDAARAAADILLTEPGLAPIAHAVLIAREVSHRIRSYAYYRLSCSSHFLLFLPIASLAFSYEFPASYITTFAIINDFVNIAITSDNAIPLLTPDKWRLSQILSVGVSLAASMAGSSYAHYFVARGVLGYEGSELDTLMFCHISFLQRFVACGTRLKTAWWKPPHPSGLFLLAILLSHMLTFFFACFGVLSARLPVGTVFALFGIELGLALLLDHLKMALYHVSWLGLWTSVLPLKQQRQKLRRKRDATARGALREAAIRKVWSVVHVITAVRIFNCSRIQQQRMDKPNP